MLPAWAGFQSRRGAYGGRDAAARSDGTVALRVVTRAEDDVPAEPSPAQVAAFAHLQARQSEVREAVLAALLGRYAEWRAEWAEVMEPQEFRDLMPAVAAADGFRGLIGLAQLHVLPVERGGVAYVGLEFGCTWDEEHGLGFMTHGGRVVEAGGADSAFLQWVAERDVEGRRGATGA